MNENDERAIAARVEGETPESVRQLREESAGILCACVGAPPGCTLCYCAIREEAQRRVLGES